MTQRKRRYKPIRNPTPLSVSRALNTLLDGAYWLPSVSVQERYVRRQDDTDGSFGAEQDLGLAIGPDGDVWVLPGTSPSLRFRTYFGGGQSPRVRNALLVLAEAIRRDNEDAPQRQS